MMVPSIEQPHGAFGLGLLEHARKILASDEHGKTLMLNSRITRNLLWPQPSTEPPHEAGGDGAALPPPLPNIPPDKATPYLPASKSRRNADYNGRVQVRPASVPGVRMQRVVCIDLAEAYVLAPKKSQHLAGVVANEDQIRTHFDGRLNDTHLDGQVRDDTAVEGKHKHAVSLDRLGIYLRDVAAQARMSDDGVAEIQISTPTHALAFSLRWKDAQGLRISGRLCQSLYDPNVTDNHLRVEVADPDELTAMTLEGLLELLGLPGIIHPYMDDSDPNSLILARCLDTDLSCGGLDRYVSAATKLEGRTDQVGNALRWNMPQTARALWGPLGGTSATTCDEIVQRLTYPNSLGHPLLCYDYHLRGEGAIDAAADLLHMLGVRGQRAAQVLAGAKGTPDERAQRGSTNAPAVHSAIRRNCPEIIRALGRACRQLEVSNDDVVALLLTADCTGWSAQSLAARRGHTAVFEALTEVCEMLDFNTTQSMAVLHGITATSDFSTGFMALAENHAQITRTLGLACKRLRLSAEHALTLVRGEGPGGTGVDVARRKGNVDALAALRTVEANLAEPQRTPGSAASRANVAPASAAPAPAGMASSSSAPPTRAGKSLGLSKLRAALTSALEGPDDGLSQALRLLWAEEGPLSALPAYQREAARRALHNALRPDADRIVRCIRQARLQPRESRTWGELETMLRAVVSNPVARLHPQAYAALTERSRRSERSRHDPSISAKLSERLARRGNDAPRLSTIQAKALIEGNLRTKWPLGMSQQVRRQAMSVLTTVSRPQRHRASRPLGTPPLRWIDRHPDPDALRTLMGAFFAERAAAQPDRADDWRNIGEAIDRDLADVMRLRFDDPAHRLHPAQLAQDIAELMWDLGFSAVAGRRRDREVGRLRAIVLAAISPEAQETVDILLRVVSEHVAHRDLEEWDRSL